ncbi:G-type lectin S-receptor-like serine/threonine-protein kinase At2g19130 [Physcomitrium patens]|uniref:Receptor-like serine/threonine-protein kinase n=1 Tax=Physcomitrium patens TaxID=3218 RepID=A0A2K1KEJ6_PHYPA|nr:G-type lectin S-receptor-like serine/threonine-protein kinase At2g19130 [Physcomitrium patens]PNR52200.1 hypothetical protein PHYPA_008574 [Physcomitrium patens]|eukprot:XP_024379160.1 G-type lectin S-receptor-like serine/threonine-protein kinase At2g19130 [Physcomitrella patens]
MERWVPIRLVVAVSMVMTTRIVAQSASLDAQSFGLNATLGGNQTWLSENGTFTMGFYPIPANSSSLYLAVWYSGVPVAPVWLMNRERAVKSGATLTLNNAGSLVLANADGSSVWTSNTSGVGVVGGKFLENGNIVLRNSSNWTMWDSFDYPTDTFLPGLIVQVGHKFTSWRTNSDPSPGLYTFEMLADGQLYFKWNGTETYYNSGPWGGSYFTNPPQLGRTTSPDVFHFDNSTGSPRFYYNTSGRSATADISLKRMRLDPDGVARQHIWVIDSNSWQTFISAPVEPCDSYHVCGKNSLCISSNYIPGCTCLPDFRPVSAAEWSDQDYWLQGCGRDPALLGSCTTNASIANSTSDFSFMALAGATIEVNRTSPPQFFFNDTESACRERCAGNCSCGSFSFSEVAPGTSTATNCTLHSTSTVFFNARSSNVTSNDSTGTPFMLRFLVTPNRERGDNNGSSFNGAKLIITVVIVCCVVVAVAASLLWWLCIRRRDAKRRADAAAAFSVVGLARFTYKELVDATGNFGHQLGSGGFGTVFQGTLPDKSEVAVKTLNKLRQGEQEFRAEVAVIGTVQHINLVQLRGFCAEGDHRALVYEYIPNGSLEKYLFRRVAGKGDGPQDVNNVMDWRTRMAVALGAARGIAYLHHECRSSIIHCDVKPENILLSGDFTPKVADFGLAKLMGKDVSRLITNIRGTRGYLAPEWLTNCTLTSKVDVYSYGMTLLEIISGRRTVDLSYPADKWFYAVWAYKEISKGRDLTSLVDDRLAKGSVDAEELRRALHVGLWCTQDDPVKRPNMRDVEKMLEGVLDVNDAPAPPSYIAQTDEACNSGDSKIASTDEKGSQLMNGISFEYTQTFSGR